MNKFHPNPDNADPIPPPEELIQANSSQWIPLQGSHPLIAYLNSIMLGKKVGQGNWQGARYSRSVYLYQEPSLEFKLIVKFYDQKTGKEAARYAERELEKINRVRSAGLDSGKLRAIRALATWRGVLLLEYVSGLTLGDVIAVRRSQPGLLESSLAAAADLLAKLHSRSIELEIPLHPDKPIEDALKYTAGLEKYGVIKDEPTIGAAIHKLISSWRLKPVMSRFTPALCHGDATTTNFIFPDQGQVVGIDWERLKVSDPATDIGRLLAEINHSLDQFGESRPEIAALEQLLLNEYSDRAALAGDADEFRQRALFHQASSTLRIARNGWISRMDRMALITRAMAMLSV